jgi:hypothetical protein
MTLLLAIFSCPIDDRERSWFDMKAGRVSVDIDSVVVGAGVVGLAVAGRWP